MLASGPSRTGGIEQAIVLGAHGSCRERLIVVEERPGSESGR